MVKQGWGRLTLVDWAAMADSTKPIYLVQHLDNGRWYDALTTIDKAKAEELLKQLGDKGRIEVFRPRPKSAGDQCLGFATAEGTRLNGVTLG